MAIRTSSPFRGRSRPPITTAVQNLHVHRRFPGFDYCWKKGEGVRRGALQPRITSPVYRIEVRYRPGGIPSVRVLWPRLAKRAPHLYREGTLCLYWPKEWKWRADILLAETIF